HYVLPLYPAIAILIAGVIDARALSRKPFLVWGTIWWFVVPTVAGVAGIVVLAVIGRQFGLLVWPLMGAAAVMGFLAWRVYQAGGGGAPFAGPGRGRVPDRFCFFWPALPLAGPLVPGPAAPPLPPRRGLCGAGGGGGGLSGAGFVLPRGSRAPPRRYLGRCRI